MRTLLTRTLAGLALSATLASAALAVDSKDNAALRYWRAFALVTPAHVEVISGVDRNRIGDADFVIRDEAVLNILRDDSLISRLVVGAAKPDCDFAIEYDKGLDALLPHLGPMRTSAVILLLRARMDLAEGDAAHASQALEAVLRSSEHLVSDDTLISSLVSLAMFALAQPVIELGVSQKAFDANQIVTLRDALDRFAEKDPFGVLASIRREKEVIAGWAASTLRGEAGAEWLRVLPDEDAAGHLAKYRAPGGDITSHISLYELYMERAILALERRDGATLASLSEAADAGAFGDLTGTLAPSFSNLLRSLERGDTLLASLRESLAR